jgi:adenosine deaminase
VIDLYDAIRKVELHCHVEGTVRPTTVIESMRNGGGSRRSTRTTRALTDLVPGMEYRTVVVAQRLSFDEVAAVALDGIEASWLDEGEKRALRTDFEATLEGRPPAGRHAA